MGEWVVLELPRRSSRLGKNNRKTLVARRYAAGANEVWGVVGRCGALWGVVGPFGYEFGSVVQCSVMCGGVLWGRMWLVWCCAVLRGMLRFASIEQCACVDMRVFSVSKRVSPAPQIVSCSHCTLALRYFPRSRDP